MLAAKGKSSRDGTYIYTCGKCGGKNPHCNWCFGGDFNQIRSALKGEYMGVTPRGQTYYSLLKEFLRIAGKPMVEMARGMEQFTPVEVGYISLHFGLNFKATWEWLNECGCAKPYHKVAKLKVSDIYAATHERYGDIKEWQPK